MARWLAIFEDQPEEQSSLVRKQFAKDHLDYLSSNERGILLAGALRDEPEGGTCGGAWVLEASSRADAAALCENDPFYRHGVRKSYRLYAWGKAPVFGAVSL